MLNLKADLERYAAARGVWVIEQPSGTFTLGLDNPDGAYVIEISDIGGGGYNASVFEDGVTRVDGVSGVFGPALYRMLTTWLG